MTDAAQLGRLFIERHSIEERIAALRKEAERRAITFARIGRLLVTDPERLFFLGQTIAGEFAAGGEPIDRTEIDIDHVIEDLRAAIVRKKTVTAELSEMGFDPEEAEREELARKSRALHHPATSAAGDREKKPRAVGFAVSRRREKAG